MPNALPRVAEPDEHRIQFTDVFSNGAGPPHLQVRRRRQPRSRSHDQPLPGRRYLQLRRIHPGCQLPGLDLRTPSPGSPAIPIRMPAIHYNTFVQTIDVVNTKAGTQGKDDFWMKMYRWLCRGHLEAEAEASLLTVGVRYDVQLTPAPGLINNNYPPHLHLLQQDDQERARSRAAACRLLLEPQRRARWFAAVTACSPRLNQGSTYYAMRVENGVVQINYNYNGCKASVGTAKSTCPTVPNTQHVSAVPQCAVPAHRAIAVCVALSRPAAQRQPSSAHLRSDRRASTASIPTSFRRYAHEMNLSVEQALPGQMSLQRRLRGHPRLRLPVFLDSNLVGQTPQRRAQLQRARCQQAISSSNLRCPSICPSDRLNTSLASYQHRLQRGQHLVQLAGRDRAASFPERP